MINFWVLGFRTDFDKKRCSEKATPNKDPLETSSLGLPLIRSAEIDSSIYQL